MNNGTFSGKVARVTGGTSGIAMFAAGLLMFRGGRLQLDPLADPLMRGLRHDACYTDLLMKIGLPRSI